MIKVEEVTKSFTLGKRTVRALHGINLHVREPGTYAIMGASGSGKSTLLHLLAGLDTADEGTIIVDGHRLDQMNERELTVYRRDCIGIIFQQFNLISTMTARMNIELPGMLAGKNADWLHERSSELLAALSLTDRADHRPAAMSGGEQQRVAIARALLFSPRVIFADEPTGNLDSYTGEQFWQVLEKITEETGTTVITVTHEPFAAIHCRKVFILLDGQIIGSFDTEGMDVASLSLRYQQLTKPS